MTEPDQSRPSSPPETLDAVVTEIVEDRAIVLVGDAQETWDFPMEMLPERVVVGTNLIVEMVDGRPAGASLHREREAVSRSSLDTRLARLARYEQLMGHEVRIE